LKTRDTLKPFCRITGFQPVPDPVQTDSNSVHFIGAGSGGMGAGFGEVGGIGAGSVFTGLSPFPGAAPGGAVGGGGPAGLPSSSVASSSMLITNSAEPCITVSVGTVRVAELTNFVVLLRPAPSSI
jgi:hypothetical protein